MKRIILLLVVLNVFMGIGAQDGQGSWSIVPRVGLNSSLLTMGDVYLDDNGTETMKAKHRWGMTAGMETQYQCWSQLGISVGLMYSNEGCWYDNKRDVDEWKHSLHFLSIPLLANFYIDPKILSGLSLKTGVQLGYLLHSKETLMGTTNTATDSYHRVNVSIPVGISYEYYHLVADLRYNIGLSNLCNHKYLDETWRDNSLWLTLGYQFRM